MKETVCTVAGVVGGFIATILGGWDSAIVTLLIFMGVDFVTGFVTAAIGKSKHSDTGTLNSKAGGIGLAKKFCILLMIVVAVRIDILLGTTYKLQFREDELQTFVKKNLIRSWSPLKSKSFISYIPNKQFWNYQELYKDVVPAPPSNPQSVSIRIWNGISSIWSKLRDWCCLDCTHEAEIKRFLKQTAHDFCQQYVQTDSIRSKKQVWAADPKKIQYFRDTWYARINTLSDTDELKTQKKDYMDIVIAEMQDADQNANRHLNERTRQRKNLFRLPILAAMFSVVATMDDFFETEIPIEFFGIPFAGLVEFGCTLASIICATLTAWQAVAQEYGKEAEETWLRQKIYFAKLQNETQKFCDVLKPYNESEVENNIEKYIENIEEVRKMDWKNFFDNMGCQNDAEL